jgi:hypothetical protein
MAIAAIARRRRLLNDEVIISLADSSWKFLTFLVQMSLILA